jgi:hypothetical protein
MNYGYIYKTTCFKTNKIYIGQSTYIKGSPYYLGSGLLLTRAIDKYGKFFFKKEILGYCTSQKELDEAEIECIEFFQSTNKLYGYNIQLGGSGGKHSQETINKMHKPKTSEHNKKVSEALKGKPKSKEHIEKNRIAGIKKGISPEIRKLGTLALTGKHLSEETKEKIRQSNLGQKRSEESKKRMSESHKGKTPWNKGLHRTV